jgi:hypothetical protein
VSTFAHLKHVRCLTTPYEPFDIGIIGAPFDTAVSYRPGMLFPRGNLRFQSCFRSIFSCICVPIFPPATPGNIFALIFVVYHSFDSAKYTLAPSEPPCLLTSSPRRTLWSSRHPSSFSPPNTSPRLQHASRHQPLHVMAAHSGLRRHPRNTV